MKDPMRKKRENNFKAVISNVEKITEKRGEKHNRKRKKKSHLKAKEKTERRNAEESGIDDR